MGEGKVNLYLKEQWKNMWWAIIMIVILFVLAIIIDKKRRHNKFLPPTDVKPGEDKNVMMGDNKYTNSN